MDLDPSKPRSARIWPWIIPGAVLVIFIGMLSWVPREAMRVKRNARLNAASGASTDAVSPENMVWIPTGVFWMGSADGQADEQPVHRVTMDGFWIDKTEVTNRQFEQFVKATGYVTTAERKPDAKDFPGVPEDKLVAGSICFRPPPREVPLDNWSAWWDYVPGANWRHPDGPASDLKGKEQYPVVQVSWDDASAYSKWAGKRLPSEAEWECAARGGLNQQPFVWGKEFMPGGHHMANTWQGVFPVNNTAADGFAGLAPVAKFPPNRYGLFDMAGNVWEWCADWYRPDYYRKSDTKNPRGPEDSLDPGEPGVPKRVTRGGSFMCSDTYCKGYRPATRMKTSPDTSLQNTGFRCVKSK